MQIKVYVGTITFFNFPSKFMFNAQLPAAINVICWQCTCKNKNKSTFLLSARYSYHVMSIHKEDEEIKTTCLINFFFGGGSLDAQDFIIIPLLGLLLQLLGLLYAFLGTAEVFVFVQSRPVVFHSLKLKTKFFLCAYINNGTV